MNIESFADRLQQAMQLRNLKSSQIEKISEKLFNDGKIKKTIKMPLITDYLKGRYEAKQSNIYALALILDVDEAWLMGADVPMKREESNIAPISIQESSSALVFVYGTIPAGIPLECVEDIIDTEEIPSSMLKGGKKYFGLKVKGNSMNPDYLDGDTLILLKQDDCESGDDCVVMVNGNDGTFKRVFKNKEQKTITLQPLNTNLDENGKPLYEPITFTNEQILGLPVRILGVVEEIRRKKKRK